MNEFIVLLFLCLFIAGMVILGYEIHRAPLPEEDSINNYYGFLNDKYIQEEEDLKDFFESNQECD